MSLPAPMCFSCKHFARGAEFTCAAYPAGIPAEITESRLDNRNPWKGDHGIQFELSDPERPNYAVIPFLDESPDKPVPGLIPADPLVDP